MVSGQVFETELNSYYNTINYRFVRCLDTENSENSLDTSPNSRFHQCCMAWQHPSLPWVDLVHRGPRIAIRDSGCHMPSVNANSMFRESLFSHWIDSFRSLFQVKHLIN